MILTSYVDQYWRVYHNYRYCILGPHPRPKAIQGFADIMWFAGAGDTYIEMFILIDLMLEHMEGLA